MLGAGNASPAIQFVPSLVKTLFAAPAAGNSASSPETQFVPSLFKIFPLAPGAGNSGSGCAVIREEETKNFVAEIAVPAKTETVAGVVDNEPFGCT